MFENFEFVSHAGPYPNELTAVRIMVLEIRHRRPGAVKFVPDDGAIKSILLNVLTDNFSTIMYCYGHAFLLGMLELFEEAGNYEACRKMKDAVESHNVLFGECLVTKAEPI